MDCLPSIIVVSSSSKKSESIIKLLFSESVKINESNPDLISCFWCLDTKYYKADLTIYGINENYKRTDKFYQNVLALIIHIDSETTSGLNELLKWEDLIKECNPEVKLIVTNNITEISEVPKSKAVEWCLKNGFELVELYPVNYSEGTSTEQSFLKEKFGVERIIEALQNIFWPNLTIKNESVLKESNHKNNSANEKHSIPNIVETDDIDDFTELLSHLQIMKESIKELPINQRKQCAEQMVTAFWKAIGGESEELIDLDAEINN